MANTHVLNRSPADRLFVPDGNSAQPPAGSPPAEIGCRRSQSIPVRSNAPLARPGLLLSRGYPQNPWPGAAK
jgi:hypothetical protein